MQSKSKQGVILMTYGSATSADQVTLYFQSIYKGKASEALIADFEERYRKTGGSPLVAITKRQAALLQKKLGSRYVVRAGMRHSLPYITDAVNECTKAGATSLLGIILAPQFSSFIMDGYVKDFNEAAKKAGVHKAVIARPWPEEPKFIEFLAKSVKLKLKELGTATPVVFTTHSLPKRVVEHDPSYLRQLSRTIVAVRKKVGSRIEGYQAFQSAGHTPEEWLTPDLTSILKKLSEKKHKKVLIVPIQFLSDHLEILYDLDIAARKQCVEFGIAYHRIPLPNINPLFIDSLASIVKKSGKLLAISKDR